MKKTTMRTILGATVAAAVLSCAAGARADDPWDQTNPSDDGCADTNNELIHGARQRHDLQGGGSTFLDADWARVQQRDFRSYEVRVLNSPLRIAANIMPQLFKSTCVAIQPGLPYEGAAQDAVSVRWLSTGQEDILVRTASNAILGATAQYEIQLLETTYHAPRFNNSATQQTVLLVQNTRADAVTGQIHFFDAAGAVLHSRPFDLAARALLVLNTAAIGPVAGQSGSLLVAHDGGYGALSGKAVALEPATGFTFDTPLLPKPY